MGGIIGGLFIAWVLTWFGVDGIIIDGIGELFRLYVGRAGYYVLFAVIGLVTELFARRK